MSKTNMESSKKYPLSLENPSTKPSKEWKFTPSMRLSAMASIESTDLTTVLTITIPKALSAVNAELFSRTTGSIESISKLTDTTKTKNFCLTKPNSILKVIHDYHAASQSSPGWKASPVQSMLTQWKANGPFSYD